jgi:hypothetical protein
MLYSDQYMVKPSQVLLALFDNQVQLKDNIQGDVFRGKGVTFGRAAPLDPTDTTDLGEPYILKYALDAGEPYSTDIIISRAADIHLMLAEALNRSGDQVNALLLLNAGFNSISSRPAAYARWNDNRGIRGRAYIKAKVIPVGFTGDVMELVEDWIQEERAMELAFEGKRWFDLVRVGSRRPDPKDYVAKIIAKKNGFPGEAKYDDLYNKIYNSPSWYLPIK